MDTRTGQIADWNTLAENMSEEQRRLFLREINPQNLSENKRQELINTGRTKVGRNDACPCGSGKKFKKCCMDKG